jgi:hypothetical protein
MNTGIDLDYDECPYGVFVEPSTQVVRYGTIVILILLSEMTVTMMIFACQREG